MTAPQDTIRITGIRGYVESLGLEFPACGLEVQRPP